MITPLSALQAWSRTSTLPDANTIQVHSVESGLINQTFWLKRDATTYGVLQRLNTKIFDPRVNLDIAASTTHLQSQNIVTPTLLNTDDGDPHWLGPDGSCWRILSYVGDTTFDTLHDPRLAFHGMRLVANWHDALESFDYQFQNPRPDPHDTARHIEHLSQVVSRHTSHRLHEKVAPLAEHILSAWETFEWPSGLPTRVIHGDLKISNIRFDTRGLGAAIIDLDSVSRGRFDAEIGDALRSWCNPAGEDTDQPTLDLEIFEQAMSGYRDSAETVTTEEWHSAVNGWLRITLELSSRFLADALTESYFGWSDDFGGHGEHSLLRGRGQLRLYDQISEHRIAAERTLRNLW